MIRFATEKDIPRLGELLVQVNRVHYEGRPDIFKPNRKYTDAELQVLLSDPTRPILVYADETDTVCGYAFCVVQQVKDSNLLTDIKTLYLDDLCVDEAMRGRHIGKALYQGVVELAHTLDCYHITLNVWACNPGAVAFYKACGLQVQKTTMEQIL